VAGHLPVTGLGQPESAALRALVSPGKSIHETVKYFVLVKHFVFMFVPTNIRAHCLR
jgi:hypothetical protein